MSESDVVAWGPAIRLSADGVKLDVVPRYTLYETVQFAGGVTAAHVRLIWFDETALALNVEGAGGAIAQTGPPPTGGNALVTSWTNWLWNQWPDSGAFGSALVSTPYWVVNVGSHIRSKPLPSSLGISELAPSESPGGLTHTNASRCDDGNPAGAARGGSPRPAPLWLHHRPRCWRGSIFEAL